MTGLFAANYSWTLGGGGNSGGTHAGYNYGTPVGTGLVGTRNYGSNQVIYGPNADPYANVPAGRRLRSPRSLFARLALI